MARPAFALVPDVLKRVVTFLLVVFSFVIFRSSDLSMAADWGRKMFGIGAGSGVVAPSLIVWVVVGLVLVNVVPETWHINFPTRLRWVPVYATSFLIAYLFVNQAQTVFLYYQF